MDRKSISGLVVVVLGICLAVYLRMYIEEPHSPIELYYAPTPYFNTFTIINKNIPVLIRGSFAEQWAESINPSTLKQATGNTLFSVKENASPVFRESKSI